MTDILSWASEGWQYAGHTGDAGSTDSVQSTIHGNASAASLLLKPTASLFLIRFLSSLPTSSLPNPCYHLSQVHSTLIATHVRNPGFGAGAETEGWMDAASGNDNRRRCGMLNRNLLTLIPCPYVRFLNCLSVPCRPPPLLMTSIHVPVPSIHCTRHRPKQAQGGRDLSFEVDVVLVDGQKSRPRCYLSVNSNVP